MLDVIFFVIGLVTLILGKFKLTNTRTVHGAAARWVGVLFMLPAILIFCIFFVAGFNAARANQPLNQGPLLVVGAVIFWLCVIAGFVVAMTCAESADAAADKKRQLDRVLDEEDSWDAPRARRERARTEEPPFVPSLAAPLPADTVRAASAPDAAPLAAPLTPPPVAEEPIVATLAPITLACPTCKTLCRLPGHLGGARASCPKCKTIFLVPTPPAPASMHAQPMPVAMPSAPAAPPPARPTPQYIEPKRPLPVERAAPRTPATRSSPLLWVVPSIAVILVLGMALIIYALSSKKTQDPIVAEQPAPVPHPTVGETKKFKDNTPIKDRKDFDKKDFWDKSATPKKEGRPPDKSDIPFEAKEPDVLHAGDEPLIILAKAIKAAGQDNLPGNLTGFRIKVKAKADSGKGQWTDFTETLTLRLPASFKQELAFPSGPMITYFDGDKGWEDGRDGLRRLNDRETSHARLTVFYAGQHHLRSFFDRQFELRPLGEVAVNGKPALGVGVVASSTKDEFSLHFDRKSGLLVKLESRGPTTPPNWPRSSVIVSHQDHNGRTIPQRVEHYADRLLRKDDYLGVEPLTGDIEVALNKPPDKKGATAKVIQITGLDKVDGRVVLGVGEEFPLDLLIPAPLQFVLVMQPQCCKSTSIPGTPGRFKVTGTQPGSTQLIATDMDGQAKSFVMHVGLTRSVHPYIWDLIGKFDTAEKRNGFPSRTFLVPAKSGMQYRALATVNPTVQETITFESVDGKPLSGPISSQPGAWSFDSPVDQIVRMVIVARNAQATDYHMTMEISRAPGPDVLGKPLVHDTVRDGSWQIRQAFTPYALPPPRWSVDGAALYVADRQGAVRRLQAQTLALEAVTRTNKSADYLELSGAGILAGSVLTGAKLYVLDPKTLAVTRTINHRVSRGMVVGARSKVAVDFDKSGRLLLVDLEAGTVTPAQVKFAPVKPSAAVLAPDGKLLWVADGRNALIRYRLDGTELIRQEETALMPAFANHLTLSPDGKKLLSWRTVTSATPDATKVNDYAARLYEPERLHAPPVSLVRFRAASFDAAGNVLGHIPYSYVWYSPAGAKLRSYTPAAKTYVANVVPFPAGSGFISVSLQGNPLHFFEEDGNK